MTDEGRPTLTYFDMRGRAEAIRLLFTDQGIVFMDRRIRSAQSWQALQGTLPLGRLPHYTDPLVNLTESQAILRYLGRSTGMMPADPVAQAGFDVAQEALAEAQEQLWQFAWQEEYRSAASVFANGQLARSLRALERLFLDCPGDYWLGTQVSHVDYLAYAYLDELRAFFGAALASVEALALFHERFDARPRLRAYLDSRRRPVVFGMGLDGPKIDPAVELGPDDVFENPWTKPIKIADLVNHDWD